MIGLARHLCLQNYKPEDILILTTHKDQVNELNKVQLKINFKIIFQKNYYNIFILFLA